MAKTLLTLLILWGGLWSYGVLANGGDQRVVEAKYLINLSRAPFTPHAGDKVAFLASFVDIEKNKLVSEDLIVTVRIAKLGGIGTDKRTFLFEKEKNHVKGGILELSYTFTESGLNEIFFDFAFASNPEKVYEAPDFLIDVQRPEPEKRESNQFLLLGGGIILGLIIGLLIRRLGITR